MITNLGPKFDTDHVNLSKVRNLTVLSDCPVLTPVGKCGTLYVVWWPAIYHDPVTHEDFPQWVHMDSSGKVHRADHLPLVADFLKGEPLDYPHPGN